MLQGPAAALDEHMKTAASHHIVLIANAMKNITVKHKVI